MPSTLFGPSRLVRQFASATPPEPEGAGGDAAERLSGWFGPIDAIKLQAALQSIGPASGPAGKATARQVQALAEDVQRVRGTLAQAIARDPLALAGIKPTQADDPGYGPWQQRHIELQRQMAQMADAVRDHARQSIARLSPRLRQLAALDAAFEDLLAARTQALLPTTVALLERRYHELRKAHRQACEASGEPDDHARWREPGGWLATFAHDWRQALLAELDLRLEPAQGLADALRHDHDPRP